MKHSPDVQPGQPACAANCCNRRGFLTVAGAASTLLLSDVFGDRVFGLEASLPVQVTPFPRKQVGLLSELASGTATTFRFPDDGPLRDCLLIKTGERSGGGIGAAQDVVAFSGRCTHLGGDLVGTFQPTHNVIGPCPLHLTTFDVTRHGMVVAGHATQMLPQIILETVDDEIHATGILGLPYGYATAQSPSGN